MSGDAGIEKEWMLKHEMQTKYDATSSGYNELYRDEQYEKYQVAVPTLQDIIGPCVGSRSGARICDIGCGTLLLYEYLEEHNRDVIAATTYYIGIDLSGGMLQGARKHRNALIDIVQADAENIPLRADSCTISLSFTVIDLVPNPKQMLNECIRVTTTACIVSSLKKAQRLRLINLRVGRYIGETEKDVIFLVPLGVKDN